MLRLIMLVVLGVAWCVQVAISAPGALSEGGPTRLQLVQMFITSISYLMGEITAPAHLDGEPGKAVQDGLQHAPQSTESRTITVRSRWKAP